MSDTGCINPAAVNYDSQAIVEDYSCLYLFKHNGQCHLFQDVLPTEIEDQSFTVSFSMKGNNWVFFHDYFPDLYIHTHEYLYSLKDNAFYLHNEGQPGLYYSDQPKSFFIDCIFTTEIRRTLGMVGSDNFKQSGDLLLESVQWMSEYLQESAEQPYKTITHLSIWNSKQHTGRIALDQIFNKLQYKSIRRTQGSWSMNDFRDVLQANGSQFLLDIFNDYKLDPAIVPDRIPWYNRKTLQDQWFCVRFEFDNLSGAKVILHDMIIQAIKTDR